MKSLRHFPFAAFAITIALAALIGPISGCSGPRIKAVELGGVVDMEALAGRLREFNGAPVNVKALGRVIYPGMGSAEFGVRSEVERGFKLDAFTGAMGRLVLSAACLDDGECRIYQPDKGRLLVDSNRNAALIVGAIMAGRVPVMGKPVGAWRSGEDRLVLKLADDAGNWQLVIFPREGPPERTVLGSRDGSPGGSGSGEPGLEIVYSAYAGYSLSDKRLVAHTVLVGGHDSGDEIILEFSRFVMDAPPSKKGFEVKVPEATEVVVSNGGDSWRRLGLFWIPRRPVAKPPTK